MPSPLVIVHTPLRFIFLHYFECLMEIIRLGRAMFL